MDMHLPRRLDKFLADARLGSRSAITALIGEGRVALNGQRADDPRALVAPWQDEVCVDGVAVALKPPTIFALLHKPAGLLTAMSDPSPKRQIVASILPESWRQVAAPVGRLDRATTGALLVTDDGDLSQLLTHPDHHLTKRYLMTLRGLIDADDPRLERLREGVALNDGPTRPARCGVEETGTGPRGPCTQVWLEITEGRNQQVRRMAQAVGFKLDHLHRAAIGPLSLGELAEGHWRALDEGEIEALYEAAGGRDLPTRRAVEALARRRDEGSLTPREEAMVAVCLARFMAPKIDAPLGVREPPRS